MQGQRAGDVEERLVERERLDDRRVTLEDLVHLPAHLAVVGVIAVEEHGVRAAPLGDRRRHRRVDAVPTRLVGRSGDHATAATPTDYDRSAA